MNLHTIGYTGRTIEDFVEALQRASIQAVVDIREGPYSKRREYSRHGLADELRAARIFLVRAHQFGNPFRPPTDRRSFADCMESYREFVRFQEDELLRLGGLVREDRCALLCACARHSRCHRSELAAIVAERVPGLEIVHL